MDEKKFKSVTEEIYKKVYDAFLDCDPDEVEADYNLDNICITFFDGVKFIVNRQTPVRQIWLATKKQGLHFNYCSQTDRWISDKTGEEFYEVFNREVSKKLKRDFCVRST